MLCASVIVKYFDESSSEVQGDYKRNAGVSTQSKEVDAQSKCGAAAAPTDRLEGYA
jgi:hypothetical protein